MFKINYNYVPLDADYNRDGKLDSLENEYIITGRRNLSLYLLLNQEYRFEKMFAETYNILKQDKDFDSRSDSVDIHFKLKNVW